MKKFTLITFVFIAIVSHTWAQDKIYRLNPRQVIECKVTEVGEDLIRYTVEEINYSVDKNKVEKIEFKNGKILVFQDSMFGEENYQGQRKNALKLGFLSPLGGVTTIFYERSLKPGASLEFGLGIIGMGVQVMKGVSGVGFKAGYKFIKSPAYYQRGQRYTHILRGSYIKPELSIASYGYDNYYYFIDGREKHRVNCTSVAALVTFGNQWVFNNSFLVDVFVGVGYGYSTGGGGGYNFMHSLAPSSFPVAGTAGIKIGLLFGN